MRRRISGRNLKTWQKVTLVAIGVFFLVARCAHAQTVGDEVAAVIETRIITVRDLDYFVAELRLYDPHLLAAPVEEIRQMVVNEAVEEYLLAGWAERQMRPPEREAVDGWTRATMQRYEQMAGGRNRLNEVLRETAIEREDFLRWLHRAAQRRLIIREALALYANLGTPEMPEGRTADAHRVRLAHILARKRPGAELEETRAIILQVRRDIEAGLPFAEAARLYSEDDFTAPMGGELGWLERDDIGEAIWEAVRPLRVNEITPPVETANGFHLVQVLDILTPEQERYLDAMRREERRRVAELREISDVRLADGFELEPIEDVSSTPPVLRLQPE